MPRPTRPVPSPTPAHPHHHLHNPLDTPLAGHKKSERLLTWLIIAHIVFAAFLAWWWRRRGAGADGDGEGGVASPGGRGRAARTGLRRPPSRGRVGATYSYADLTAENGPTSVVVDGGGSTEMVGIVGMGARRVSRGALRRAG